MIDKIIITDTAPEKFKFLIGYVRNFEYLSPDVQAVFDPHPVVGGVYQILERDGQYIIHLGELAANKQFKGIFLGPSLEAETEGKWRSDIVVITKDNMLDFPISSENLQQIGNWLDSEHKQLKDELTTKISTQPELQVGDTTSPALSGLENKLHFMYCITALEKRDPDILDCLYCLSDYMTSHDTSLALRGILLHAPSTHSFLGSLVTAAEAYTKTNDSSTLLKCIELCLYEMVRKTAHEGQ